MAKRGKASGAGEASVPPALSASERETVDASVAKFFRPQPGSASSGSSFETRCLASQLRMSVQWRNHLGGIAPAHLPGAADRAVQISAGVGQGVRPVRRHEYDRPVERRQDARLCHRGEGRAGTGEVTPPVQLANASRPTSRMRNLSAFSS